MSETAAAVEAGTPRSGIGNETKRMPFAPVALASSTKSGWAASSASNKDTMTSIPACRQPLASSSSQSPPLGRAATASRPRHGPGIQKRSGFMILFPLSPADADECPLGVRGEWIAGDDRPGLFHPSGPSASLAGRDLALART